MNSRRGMGSIYDRGGVKWIKYYHHGEAVRESSGSGKDADARKLLKKRLGESQSAVLLALMALKSRSESLRMITRTITG
jgi:hypothetical protein